ncbi:MAG: hypothetical protein ABJG15_05725 [Hyphomonadaceae bacterium]
MEDTELEIEAENKDIVGGVDRLMISAGLAILAVLPTLFIVTFMPWRAAQLLAADRPNGRDSYILGPGIFFVAAIVSTFILTSTIPDREQPIEPAAVEVVKDAQELERPRSAFRAGFEAGSRLKTDDEEDESLAIGARILEGFTSGNIWQAAASIAPFFLWACLIAGTSASWGAILRMPGWTLRAAMGGALYFATTFTVISALALNVLSYLFPDRSHIGAVPLLLIALFMVLPLFALPWQTFWFVKKHTGESAHKSGLLTLGTSISLLVIMSGFLVVQAFSDIRQRSETSALQTETSKAEVAVPLPPTAPATSSDLSGGSDLPPSPEE